MESISQKIIAIQRNKQENRKIENHIPGINTKNINRTIITDNKTN